MPVPMPATQRTTLPHGKAVIAVLMLAGLALLWVPAALASARVGEVVFHTGEATRLAADHPAKSSLATGDAVFEGDRLETADDTHLHLKMVDGAFVILRSDSALKIDQYRYLPASPQRSIAQMTLKRGVVRSVSGEIGTRSRERFRLNTPVAAIGIRGTDFSVLTDDQQSRLSVRQGGVVMARLLGACRPEAIGPCDTPGMAELFASPQDILLEAVVNEPDIRLRFGEPGPDDARPPHPREGTLGATTTAGSTETPTVALRGDSLPGASTYEEALQQVERYLERYELARDSQARGELFNEIQPRDRGLVDEQAVRWGRFSTYNDTPQGQASEISRLISAFGRGTGDRWFDAQNDVFALVSAEPGPRELPTQGRAYFNLNAYEAHIKRGSELEPAAISHPGLVIDFERSAFAASFQLHSGSREPETIVGGGNLTDGGMLLSDDRSPTEMAGTLTPKAAEVGLLFQRQLETGIDAVGATHWVLDRD